MPWTIDFAQDTEVKGTGTATTNFDGDGADLGISFSMSTRLDTNEGASIDLFLNDVNPTEIGTTGVYLFTLTQAETNGHELSFTPACSTSGVAVLGSPSNVIYTTDNTAVLAAVAAVSSTLNQIGKQDAY